MLKMDLMQLKREKSPEAKSSPEVTVKRQRIETPSPLPTFKVLYYLNKYLNLLNLDN